MRIAAQVDLNIVVATGVYTYDDVPGFFRPRGPGVHPDLPEPMVEMFVRDLVEGIAGTEVRAGFLKCAIGVPGMTPGVERVLRAVAKAHLATGAPVMVHTAPRRRTGLEVHRVLTAEGVDPRRVLLAHSGDSSDATTSARSPTRATCSGWTASASSSIAPFDERVSMVAELVRRGYAEHMVLAHDAACYVDWFDPAVLAISGTGISRTSPTTCFPRCANAVSPTRTSTPCWWTTRGAGSPLAARQRS